MSSDELDALMAEPVTNCPHGLADADGCRDCLAPALTFDPVTLMRIPEEFRGATLDRVPATVRDAIAPFLAGSAAFLWLGGNVGAGKSYTACAVLNHTFLHRGIAGRFWAVTEIADCYRAASSPDYEGPWPAAALDNALMLAPLLVLDDLGKEWKTDFSVAKLYRVVDARHSERRPTIVTTNVDPGAIDLPIRSRLLSGIEVRFTGQDRRRQ